MQEGKRLAEKSEQRNHLSRMQLLTGSFLMQAHEGNGIREIARMQEGRRLAQKETQQSAQERGRSIERESVREREELRKRGSTRSRSASSERREHKEIFEEDSTGGSAEEFFI